MDPRRSGVTERASGVVQPALASGGVATRGLLALQRVTLLQPRSNLVFNGPSRYRR